MTNDEFKCWLDGYLMLTDDVVLDRKQVIIIKNHANLTEAVSLFLTPEIRNFMAFLEQEIIKNPIPLSIVKDAALNLNSHS